VPATLRDHWASRLQDKRPFTTAETLTLLADYGITTAAAIDGIAMRAAVVRDVDFGPIIEIAAAGAIGAAIEEARHLMPCDEAEAARVITAMRTRRLFDDAPGAIEGLAGAIARLSRLALDHGQAFARLDIDPLIIGPAGTAARHAVLR
jgi:hypothetical protein